MIQGFFVGDEEFAWFRIPTASWIAPLESPVSFMAHLLGTTGIILFSARFWVQWWFAEQCKESHLGGAFWLLSLLGTLLSLFYFILIKDPVNFIGPVFGMIPYVRNLMLLKKSKKLETRSV